jgi:hypothetical protein
MTLRSRTWVALGLSLFATGLSLAAFSIALVVLTR